MRISSVRAEAYTVPTDQPEADGTLTWDRTTAVVAEVGADDEVGIGWTYGPAACVDIIGSLLAPAALGLAPEDGPIIYRRLLLASRNATRPGLVTLAISAVDNAVWDLRARVLGIPIADLLGRARSSAPIYGSGGFTTYDAQQLQGQIEGWGQSGIEQVKIKIGESWGSDVARDLRRVDLALASLPDGGSLFVDANGAYGLKQAVRIGHDLQERGVTWFEEPVSSDDHRGLRYLRDHLPRLDVTAGEYGFDLDYFAQLLRDDCVDCVQIDVTRCGGITAWQRIAALAAAHHLEVSAHCAPLQHLGVACSTANYRHGEYFHDHQRIERLLFEEVPEPRQGTLTPLPGPGHGLTLNRPRLEEFRVR